MSSTRMNINLPLTEYQNVLDFTGVKREVVSHFVRRAVDHEIERALAEAGYASVAAYVQGQLAEPAAPSIVPEVKA